MARTISAPALAKLAQNYGTEPVNIVEIQWTPDSGRDSYADKDVPASGIKGRIQEISGLDAIVQVSGGSDSQQVSVTLSDVEGSIKEILDSYDVHKRPAWVYQWFTGLDVADKFLVFKGQISSPLEWDEGARTVSFDIITKIEDVEVGFSIEEGDFNAPPEDIIGEPWPLIFGKVINNPCLKTNSVRQGILATGNGVRDFTLAKRIEAAENIVCPMIFRGYSYSSLQGTYLSTIIRPIYTEDEDCIKRKCEAIESLELQFTEQGQFQFPTMTIFGGEKFPQNKTITLNINGAKFTGSFNGELFTITSRQHPRFGPGGTILKEDDDPVNVIQSECNIDPANPGANIRAQLEEEFPTLFTGDGEYNKDPVLRAKASQKSWDIFNSYEAAGFFWCNAGDTVTLDTDNEILYIANILPSTVLRVAAWRALNGGRQLLTVPSAYYTVRQTDYTSYNVCEIVFEKPLSTRDDGWSDDIYVTLISSVGPNTVDIIEWLLETYTDYETDTVSFDLVRDQIENYPMHFPVPGRMNLIDLLEQIAYQARCAIWLRDDIFYIRYMSVTPDSVDTITEDDVDANSLKIKHTATEDLITKYTAEWFYDRAIEKPNKVILRHNVKKYGTHAETFDYFCYNIYELVEKTATYWLIRKANTWRRIAFTTPIHKMNLEVFDAVAVSLPDVCNGTVVGIVEKASYNSDNHNIEFEVWLPIKSGTKVAYDFAYPSDVDVTAIFPTLEERDLGLAGSGEGPNFSTIAPNNHPLSNHFEGLVQGFTMGGCTTVGTATTDSLPCRPDYGRKKPADANDTKPTPKGQADNTGAINTGTSPVKSSAANGGASQCCQEAKDMAKEAQRRADEANTNAQQGRKDSGADDERTKDNSDGDRSAPDAPDVCGGDCTSTVKVTEITPTLVVLPPGGENSFGNESGQTGNLADGTVGKQYCWTFKRQEAANAFAAEIAAEIAGRDNYGWEVGKTAYWLINDNGGSIAPECEPIPEDEDPSAIVGYTED